MAEVTVSIVSIDVCGQRTGRAYSKGEHPSVLALPSKVCGACCDQHDVPAIDHTRLANPENDAGYAIESDRNSCERIAGYIASAAGKR